MNEIQYLVRELGLRGRIRQGYGRERGALHYGVWLERPEDEFYLGPTCDAAADWLCHLLARRVCRR